MRFVIQADKDPDIHKLTSENGKEIAGLAEAVEQQLSFIKKAADNINEKKKKFWDELQALMVQKGLVTKEEVETYVMRYNRDSNQIFVTDKKLGEDDGLPSFIRNMLDRD